MKVERVHIELTNKCNFRCEFCPQSQMTRPQGEMDFALFVKIVNEIAKEQITDTIMFHVMGEPLLYGLLEKAIDYAHAKKLKICLTTNGAIMSGSILKKMAQKKIDHIIFSVQTPTSDSFSIRRSHMAFETYMEQVTDAVAKILEAKNGTKVSLSFLSTPFKSHLTPDFKKNIISSKEDMADFCFPWISSIVNKLQKSIIHEKLFKRLEGVRSELKKMDLLGWNCLKLSDELMVETRVLGDWVRKGEIKKAIFGCCEGLTKHFGILWNGDIVFCCIDYDGETAFGNISNTTLKESFAGKNTQRIIEGFKNFRMEHPYCQKCMGDRTVLRTIVRQLGAIFYFKVYRAWWKRKREQNRDA